MKHDCNIDRQIKKAGLHSTRDRHDLLSLFDDNRAWSASQIATRYPQKELSTIYRNIQKFLDRKIICSVHTHTAEEFFERSFLPHHDHKTCPDCHVMSCVPCPIASIKQSHRLEIEEYCDKCV